VRDRVVFGRELAGEEACAEIILSCHMDQTRSCGKGRNSRCKDRRDLRPKGTGAGEDEKGGAYQMSRTAFALMP
jgi:hypothetical protein